MEKPLNSDLAKGPPGTDGRLLCFSLLPFFVIAEGLRRTVAGLKRDIVPSTQRTWFAEAKSQASIATTYALLARSMLQ
jgi:hypothetical protein